MAVKIGFIGAGGNANWHMDMLKDVPDGKVVAIADIAFDKAKAAAQNKAESGIMLLDAACAGVGLLDKSGAAAAKQYRKSLMKVLDGQ